MPRTVFAFILALSLAAAYAAGAAAQQRQPVTRVEADQKTGAVLFIVNGKEQARIDLAGLHVRDSITYGGALTAGGLYIPAHPGVEGKP